MTGKCYILGAGVSGLAAGYRSDIPVLERTEFPGGICASCYLDKRGRRSYARDDEETYRFENGGGHWIFGADGDVLNFMNGLSPLNTYVRQSAVYFADSGLYVPYPIQNHLSFLPKETAKRAIDEILSSRHCSEVSTFSDWLELHFGKTLCDLFFFPFHDLYTAGLFTGIEPQDKFKTPLDKELITRGFNDKTPPAGYNATFVYPRKGLDDLIRNMAGRAEVKYHNPVRKIDVGGKNILLDGASLPYEKLISTLPLNKILEITGIAVDEPLPPYTSVLVFNIGAARGDKCPDYHWLYIPKSKAGFHRVGFYSNVDESFLPISARQSNDRVSIYVEKAYRGGARPSQKEIEALASLTVQELREWQFIGEPEVIEHNWIEVAYTWSYPGSRWKQKAIQLLAENGICTIGRYGLWKFQGIAESIKDGLAQSGRVYEVKPQKISRYKAASLEKAI